MKISMRITAAAAGVALVAGLGLAACGGTTTAIRSAPKPAVTVTTPAPKPRPKPKPKPTETVTKPAAPGVIINNNPAPAAPAPPAAPPAAVTDPWAVVSAFYGDLEDQDYADAWSLMSPSFQADQGSYDSWVAGYANTGSTSITEADTYDDSVEITISAVDTATGETQTFDGSYTVDNGLITSGSATQVN